ncbi:hypothetical protein A3Q56_00771 [Intoshia linei]|uniref:BHLH domain-containing protein n=1 Tax=Intoshia linei TaxID=1819745 RepID=A0A177BCW0_9BILA|nr:hypothetical protein A3Q56_00771 [Intoshia linei]
MKNSRDIKNLIERYRVYKLNQKFSAMQKLLPQRYFKKKITKSIILNSAIQYIREMTTNLRDYNCNKHQYQKINNASNHFKYSKHAYYNCEYKNKIHSNDSVKQSKINSVISEPNHRWHNLKYLIDNSIFNRQKVADLDLKIKKGDIYNHEKLLTSNSNFFNNVFK